MNFPAGRGQTGRLSEALLARRFNREVPVDQPTRDVLRMVSAALRVAAASETMPATSAASTGSSEMRIFAAAPAGVATARSPAFRSHFPLEARLKVTGARKPGNDWR